MIHAKTVLVLGAGASQPYGFPLGDRFVDRLCNHKVSFRFVNQWVPEGIETLLHRTFQENELAKFRQEFRASGLSIDDFLTAQPVFSEIGKAAIAATLIPFEDPNTLPQSHNGDWCKYLRNLMGASFDDFRDSAQFLHIVTFNYDRSFEYLFWRYLKASYGQQKAIELFQTLKIIHVYGQLGKPDFLFEDGREYGGRLDNKAVEKCVAEIKVIPEDVDDSAEFRAARDLMRGAEVLCFLGFGYLAKNIRRLKVQENFSGTRMMGTAFGLGVREAAEARAYLGPKLDLGSAAEDAFSFLRNHDVFGPAS